MHGKKHLKNRKKKASRKRGRPKGGEALKLKELTRLEKQKTMSLDDMVMDLPKVCDIGAKQNAKELLICWKDYKFHIDTADGQIPNSCLLTSASLDDSQVAIPLALMTKQCVTNLYDVMDAAYDSEIIREHSKQLGHVP